MRSWPDPVQRVVAFLERAGAEVRVEEFPAGTHTAEAAAEAVGGTASEIVKSLVFEGGGRSVVALVPGDRRADDGKIAAALGTETVRIATPDRVRELTGFEPGAVAPFALGQVDLVLLDRRLMLRDHVRQFNDGSTCDAQGEIRDVHSVRWSARLIDVVYSRGNREITVELWRDSKTPYRTDARHDELHRRRQRINVTAICDQHNAYRAVNPNP